MGSIRIRYNDLSRTSFSIVRSHMVDKDLLRAKRQKEAEKRKKEEKKKNAKAAPTSFQVK